MALRFSLHISEKCRISKLLPWTDSDICSRLCDSSCLLVQLWGGWVGELDPGMGPLLKSSGPKIMRFRKSDSRSV